MQKFSEDSLRNIKGIGEKTEKLFQKLGICTTGQLLRYYPRDYDSYEIPVPVSRVTAGHKNSVLARISKIPSVRVFGRNSITMIVLQDQGVSLQVNWFHMPFLKNTLKVGHTYVFRGEVIRKGNRLIMEHPEIFEPQAYEEMSGQLLPIYALTAGLSNKTLRRAVSSLLAAKNPETEYLPGEIRETYGLAEINYALEQIHFPDSRETLLEARKRLAFDEFFFFLLGVRQMKEERHQQENHFPMREVWRTEDVIESLPYRMTRDQYAAWRDITRDLAGSGLMNRLIQGDVGSGKTILAFLAMVQTFENGYQSALMVPTEVLAEQHYRALTELLEKNEITDAHPVLLTGSRTAKEKRQLDEEIESGTAKMIVGTHALFQEKVRYRNLGLVITDEQHRFGVRQREALAGKGYPPNVLVMSATPIPRTLALMLYGDLDISMIREKPSERLPVKNCVVDTSWRENAYRFMERQIAEGHQIYIICPMVEENEELPCENVTDYTEKMRERFGGGVCVEMLHGRMKPAEKQEIMERFAAGGIQILVSTTVVEVGVNVPNATVMMIENAERFGLAQLHQLRGRVGRGPDQSYCIFMQGDESRETSKRLQILSRSNDGFAIAEEDLKLRGPGDLFGVRQSGLAIFRIADIYRDTDILAMADSAVKDLVELDPDLTLPQNAVLKKQLDAFLGNGEKPSDV